MTRGRIAPLLGLLAFALALWLLHHALRDVRYADVVRALRALPRTHLVLAVLFTCGGYLALTAYDTLGCRYVGRTLPYRRTALAAFVGYAVSQTLGIPLLSGGAVRLRFYSAWGLTTSEIAGIIGFSGVTFWLGFATLGGVVFLVAPPRVPPELHLPIHTTRPLGVLLLTLALSYLVVALVRRTALSIRGWEIAPPPRWMLAPQLAVAVLDWTFAGATLWALLPPSAHVTFASFLGVFLLAQCAGLVSHVPGGLGVFESVVILLLTPRMEASAVVGALVAFRAVYYFVPLGVAMLLLAAHELALRRHWFHVAARAIDEWATVVPTVLAVASFLAGALLLVSGATPAVHWRLALLERVLPLPVLETSHFLASLAGVGLLLLARDLQRRVDGAYVATAALLATGAVVSLLKGFDYEEALVLGLTLAAVLPCRREFYRHGTLLRAPFTPGWTAAIVVVIGASVWLLLFAHRHVEYARELWWQFEFGATAPRAMRATTGAAIVALFAGVWQLLRPSVPEPTLATRDDLARARAVVADDPGTLGNLALLGDKALLFGDGERAFLMYGIEGRSWIAMGDPIGEPAERAELAWRFRELSDRHDGDTVFYQVGSANLPLYLDLGLTLLKVGEEGRVPLAEFSLAGGARKSLRQLVRRLADERWTFRIAAPAEVDARMAELRAVSDAWLAEKHTREKGFSLGFFSAEYVRQFPAALVERDGAIAAFANLWCGGGKEELSIDLMRHRPTAPSGVMDLLFADLMLWGKAQGYAWFNLGMAPLSGLSDHALAPLWARLGALAFHHGEHFYNFQGLRAYKEKFDPVWTPRYLATPGGLALPRVLANLAALVSGGLRGVLGN